MSTSVEIASPSTPVSLLLDGGTPTEKTAKEIRRRHRDRVKVHRLEVDEIEQLFRPEAIARWLQHEGAPGDSSELDRLITDIMGTAPSAKRALQRVAQQVLGRHYREVDIAREIALADDNLRFPMSLAPPSSYSPAGAIRVSLFEPRPLSWRCREPAKMAE